MQSVALLATRLLTATECISANAMAPFAAY